MTVKELREKEQHLLEMFLDCCIALVDLDAGLLRIHNQLAHEGEQSKQPYSKQGLISEAKNIISREGSRQRMLSEAANLVAPQPTGVTYDLAGEIQTDLQEPKGWPRRAVDAIKATAARLFRRDK